MSTFDCTVSKLIVECHHEVNKVLRSLRFLLQEVNGTIERVNIANQENTTCTAAGLDLERAQISAAIN